MAQFTIWKSGAQWWSSRLGYGFTTRPKVQRHGSFREAIRSTHADYLGGGLVTAERRNSYSALADNQTGLDGPPDWRSARYI
jgi:hypothetical protein